jgi:diaminopimelate epimerase
MMVAMQEWERGLAWETAATMGAVAVAVALVLAVVVVACAALPMG